MRWSSPPGTIKIFDMNVAEVRTQTTSTHGINLERTISLAAALGKAPEKAIVVGIEGKLFGDGDKLSPEVADAVVDAVKMIDQIVLSELE